MGIQFAYLILIVMVVSIVVWWKYAPYPQKLKCKMYGHDYHKGLTKDLFVQTRKEKYLYDFCQRCHTRQNKRPAHKNKVPLTRLNEHGALVAPDGAVYIHNDMLKGDKEG